MKALRKNVYTDIKHILQEARNGAVRAVNFSMVMAYWDIGRRIVEEEQGGSHKAGYGLQLLEELATRLTKDFGKGFTLTNLKYFRQFYIVFSQSSIGHAVRDQSKAKGVTKPESAANIIRTELSWTHYRYLIGVESTAA